MVIAFPGESAEYRAARNRLLEQEIELRSATEAIAAARRRLPPGGLVPEDYVFQARGPDGGPAAPSSWSSRAVHEGHGLSASGRCAVFPEAGPGESSSGSRGNMKL